MKALVPLLAAVSLAACGGDGMSDINAMTPPPMATPAAKTSFTTFTEKLISSQSETEEPRAVATTDFYFPDDDNEAAFAAVVPAA
jgi:hypothetical protein